MGQAGSPTNLYRVIDGGIGEIKMISRALQEAYRVGIGFLSENVIDDLPSFTRQPCRVA